MKTLKELSQNFGLSIGLGFFDGVHLAHQAIINKTVEAAKKNGLKSAIITFEKSPIECLHPEKKQLYLTTNNKKIELIKALGVDFLYLLDFNSIKEVGGQNYIQNILYENFQPKFITTGFNNHFGKNCTGSPKLLEEFSEKFNYTYFPIPPQKMDGTLISSTKIKQLIKAGEINLAHKFLGRNFEIENMVEMGNKLGRTIGFPTANLTWPNEIVKLPHMVYSGIAKLQNNETFPCLINWGARPTVDNKEILEVHLLNFNREIYGQKLTVSFVKKIREQVKFENIESLKRQIAADSMAV